jgi:Bax protein
MKIIGILLGAIKRDKSYLIGAVFTFAALFVLIVQHDWQSRPANVASLDFVTELPDFTAINDVQQKKAQFFAYLRPLVDKENNKIKYKKELLLSILTKIKTDSYHSGVNAKKLNKLAKEFGLKSENLQANIEELKSRIDIIPSSLVLAQAANESAWGTSRFATNANNLFGQWCYTAGCGLVPQKRNTASQHEVRKYASVQDSISSYMRNLNSHNAYTGLRDIRAGLRRRGQPITGVKLAHGLSSYSERGQDYVDELISMIKHNSLE